jgi:hypothetical protein
MPVQHVYVLGEKSETENPFKFKNVINVSEREATKLVGKCGTKCDVSFSSLGFILAPGGGGDAQTLSK